MGGAKSAKGKGKGKATTKSSGVISPWVKQSAAVAAPTWRSAGKATGKGKTAAGKSASKGGFTSKGKVKGKGKGKGKKKGPASFDSEYWVSKLEEENRTELTGTYTGTIAKYVFKQGWGFIAPDDPESLPPKAKKALKQQHAAAEAEGKTVSDPSWLYFRKPDVDRELFPLANETAVTFEVYVDVKGAGAHNIAGA
mmetsp:Transcript_64478/g.185315  ORF Transcript_64478/g.185315 Transcript_64478/m.185315 type:complete len:196 (-) Transcript_64478:7-594(-)